jgi:putative transcription factor
MQCELCGKEYRECRPAEVDGVRMLLCFKCLRHGQGVKEVVETPEKVQRSLASRLKRAKVKDVYENMNKELVPGWHELIKHARMKKGLSREELGFRIGERTVTIAKIENNDLRPSDSVAEKLEKELGITLFEEIKRVARSSGGSSSSGLTIGDFLKTEKKP